MSVMGQASSSADDRERLDLLLRDYESAANDERYFLSSNAAVMGVGITVLSVIAALLTQVCSPKHPLIDWLKVGSTKTDCSSISPYVMAFVPTLPVLVLAVLLVQGTLATMRSRYLRSVASEIRTLVHVPDDAVTPFGLVHILQPLSSGRSLSVRHRALSHLQWLPAASIAIGVGVLAVNLIDNPSVRLAAGGLYGLMAVILIGGIRSGYIRSLRMWQRLVKRLPNELNRTRAGFPAADRLLYRYILLPRPLEVLSKAPIHALAFVLASVLSDGHVRFRRIAFFTLILEFVLYQARYAINDLRDVENDKHHPSSRARGRLNPSTAAVRSGLIALCWRVLALPVSWIALKDGDLRGALIVAAAVVAASTVAYESVREHSREVGAAGLPTDRLTWVTLGLVGIGYGLRLGTGLHLGGVGTIPTIAGTSFGYWLGILFVGMTWTLEGYSFETFEAAKASKPHVAYLTAAVVRPPWLESPLDRLKERTLRPVQPIGSPIPLIFACALVSATLFSTTLQLGGQRSSANVQFAVVQLGMAASCFFLSRRVEGSEMIRWMLVLLSCAVGAFAYLGDRSAIAVLPLLLLNTVHWFFKFMCYDDVNIDFGFILAVAIHKLRCNLALLLEGALGPVAYLTLFGRSADTGNAAREVEYRERFGQA